MNIRKPPRMVVQIDMTPDGQFRGPPPAGKPPGAFTSAVLRYGILIAVLAASGAMAALALWLALSLIPIAIGAVVVVYAIIRFRMWRARR